MVYTCDSTALSKAGEGCALEILTCHMMVHYFFCCLWDSILHFSPHFTNEHWVWWRLWVTAWMGVHEWEKCEKVWREWWSLSKTVRRGCDEKLQQGELPAQPNLPWAPVVGYYRCTPDTFLHQKIVQNQVILGVLIISNLAQRLWRYRPIFLNGCTYTRTP